MADLTKSTLPSVALLLATLIIIVGVTGTVGQSSASSLIEAQGELVDGLLSGTGNLVESISQGSLLAVHGGPNQIHGELTNDDVRKELDKFGVKVIKHVEKFCDKYAETVRKVKAGRVFGKLTDDDDVHKELEKFDAKVIKRAEKFCDKFAETVREAEAGQTQQAVQGGLSRAGSFVGFDQNFKSAGWVPGGNNGNNN